MRSSTKALDRRFYKAHNRLPRLWRKEAVRLHYALFGRRAGLQPHPLFDPQFFGHELERVIGRGRSPADIFDDYLDDRGLWDLDPHPFVFLQRQPFASAEPASNPLIQLRDLVAGEGATAYGHPFLDPEWWVAHNENVSAKSTLDEVLRDVVVRISRARLARAEVALGPDPDVLFINGEDHCPACTQYRVWAPAEALRSAGLRVAIVNARDVHRLEGVRVQPRCAIAFRALGRPSVMAFIARLKVRGVALGFDCDDMLFGATQDIGLQESPEGFVDPRATNRHAALMNEVVRQADFAVFPTTALAGIAADLGVPDPLISVVPSFLTAAQVAAADSVPSQDVTPGHSETLIAASGTWTHQDDFRVMLNGVVAALRARPSLRLQFLGAALPNRYPELDPVRDRVDHDPEVVRGWAPYVDRYRGALASLVPLDADNGFCQAKSEVKYLEAGIVGTPTIASPTEAYRRALTGPMLARTSADWAITISALAGDVRSRATAGNQTRRDVLARYGPQGTHSQEYVRVIQSILDNQASAAGRSSAFTSRWGLSTAVGRQMLSPPMRSLAETMSAAGWLVRREPRETDLFIATTGEEGLAGPCRIIWTDDVEGDPGEHVVAPPPVAHRLEGKGAAVSVALPWVDPRVFYPRGAHAAGRPRVSLIFPRTPDPETFQAMRLWREWADDRDWTLVALGIAPSQSSLTRHDHWERGSSDIELATLLRRSTITVQLSSGEWDELITGAVLTGPRFEPAAGTVPYGTTGLPAGWTLSHDLGLAIRDI